MKMVKTCVCELQSEFRSYLGDTDRTSVKLDRVRNSFSRTESGGGGSRLPELQEQLMDVSTGRGLKMKT